MKALISRTLIVKLSYSSFSHLYPPFLRSHLIRSAAGEEAYRRRNESGHFFSSSSSSLNPSPSSRRNYEEENRNVKITVWWDFENCNIPGGVNAHLVANRITWAIRSSGIKGPVTITAFGDVVQLSRATQEALTSTGICLNHVPHSGKNSSDRSFMADIVNWVSQNPPPAHFFLISGDKDFANILHRLRMSNYNILIASTDSASGVLCSAATIMWPWYGLVRGVNVIVKHFNYPPDGLYGSWYGHYKGVLDNPFANTDHPTISQPEESMESISLPKTRPIPKAVVKGIRQVLHSYPDGISLSELRSELKKSCITIDKDFYGHKKFSLFLESLNLLKVISPPVGDVQPLVFDTLKKGTEQADVSQSPFKETCTNGMLNGNAFTLKGGDSLLDKASISTNYDSNFKGRNLDANSSATALHKGDHPMVNLEVHKSTSVPQTTISDPFDVSQKKDIIVAKERLIKKLWNSLRGHSIDSVLKKNDDILELDSSREDSSKNALNLLSSDLSRHVKPKDETEDMNNLIAQKENKTSSMDAEKSFAEGRNIGLSESPNNVHEQKVNLLGMFIKWCKSMIYGANDHNDNSESDNKVHQIDVACISGKASSFISNHPAAHELFSKPHFWDDLESFLLDSKGRHVILKSITREHLLRSLQNEGPSSLKELDDTQLSQLGDILILEKKWVEESSFQKFPYKLIITAKNNFVRPESHHLNGLSSLFPDKTIPNLHKQSDQKKVEQNHCATEMSFTGSKKPPCNITELKLWFQNNLSSSGHIEPEEFQKLFENKFNRKLCCSTYGYANIPSLIAACSTVTGTTPSKKPGPPSRDEILSDCRKLLKELLKKNPTGFAISIFQTEFLLKYGYILDYKTLGYPKLTKLLQIFPGIKVESTCILPSEEHANDVTKEEEENHVDDSAWDELGPLSNSSNHGNGKDCKMDKEPTFSPVSLSDDEFTDSEEDTPVSSDRSSNSKQSTEDGSLLLKILDSWDDHKLSAANKQHKDTKGMAKPSSIIGPSSVQKLNLRTSPKCFSFVANEADDKESFAQSILGEVKKAGDLRLKQLSK